MSRKVVRQPHDRDTRKFHVETPCSFSFVAKCSSKNAFAGADVSLLGLSPPRRDSASTELPRLVRSSRLLLSARGESDEAMHSKVHTDKNAQESRSDLVVIVLAVFSVSRNLLDGE